MVIDLMDVIKSIEKYHPTLDIRSVGPSQTIVELVIPRKRPPVFLVFFVWVLLFIGSGLAIMNFHADVSMTKVLARIYYLVTGEQLAQSSTSIADPLFSGDWCGDDSFFQSYF